MRPFPLRRHRGFTLVELLVALFAMAIMAALGWRGLDGMVRAQQLTAQRADEVLALQTGLAQWAADLDAVVTLDPIQAMDWNGRVLRLTRRSGAFAAEGVIVVGWTQREGRWLRWESPPATTRGEVERARMEADLWSQNPGDAQRRREVAIAPLQEWQLFYFRGDAWTNPLSSDATAGTGGTTSGNVIPDGVRLVLRLAPGQAITGELTRDWVRPTLGGDKS
jgi:general secretion pathway protein J